MRQRFLLSWSLLTVLAAVPAAHGKDPKGAETLAELKQEAERVRKVHFDTPDPGTMEARMDANHRYQEKLAPLGRRALALVDSDPDSPEAPDVLAWVLTDLRATYPEAVDVLDEAYDRMARRYVTSPAIKPLCRAAERDALNTTHGVAFLRAAAERSPIAEVRGLSSFCLGRSFQERARVARALGDAVTRPILQRNLGPDRCQMIQSRAADDYRREAVAAYQRTIREYADQPGPLPHPSPLGKQAEGALFRLRNLEVGCTLPDVEGIDLEGKPLKLSDFRGKVVVLTFWAAWCGPCLALVPSEKELVERMKGRPFVLLGVNGDEDLAKARAVVAKEGVNWRSYWDGGPSGTIARKWNVTRWPTIFVIDAAGTIRDDGIIYFEYLHKKALEKAFEHLVAEAEALPSRSSATTLPGSTASP